MEPLPQIVYPTGFWVFTKLTIISHPCMQTNALQQKNNQTAIIITMVTGIEKCPNSSSYISSWIRKPNLEMSQLQGLFEVVYARRSSNIVVNRPNPT